MRTVASDFMASGYQAGVSFYFGVPFLYPPYYWPYLYQSFSYPPVYQVPSLLPGYIESQKFSAYGEQNWFYCPGADSYYPRVTDCPEGWQTVSLCPD